VQWQSFVKIFLYTFLLVVVQAHWVARMPHPALRIDLLLPLMFGIAAEWSPASSLLWALVWGYALDALSGKFWGFHIGSYVLAICLVNVASEKLEFQNPLYQMTFVGTCALAQSLALGIFLFFESAESYGGVANWVNLLFRSMITTVLAPLIIYPVFKGDKVSR
jgi:rod shape-determining protein MreD